MTDGNHMISVFFEQKLNFISGKVLFLQFCMERSYNSD